MGTTGKEPVLRQLLKFFERKSPKNVPNSLITLESMLSDFEAFSATLSQLTFGKVLLQFFICSLIATMLG